MFMMYYVMNSRDGLVSTVLNVNNNSINGHEAKNKILNVYPMKSPLPKIFFSKFQQWKYFFLFNVYWRIKKNNYTDTVCTCMFYFASSQIQ